MKKKLTALFLTAAMTLSLAACGGSASSAPTAASAAASIPASTAASTAVSAAASTAASSSAAASSTAASAAASTAASSASSGTKLSAATVTIFIAASLEKVFTDAGKLNDMYKEQQPDVTIEVNAGSSGTLEQQIEQGAPCDLFFSAGKKQMKAAKEAGYVLDGTQVNLLENEVVLIKRKGADTKVTDFSLDSLKQASSIALCADSVPAGQYARTIFKTLGYSADDLTKAGVTVNECDKVTAALSAVAQGSNEVGIVYASDAANESGVEVLAKASKKELAENPLYPVALIKNQAASAAETAAAADYIKFLQSDEAMKVFEEYTFIAHDQSADSAASSSASSAASSAASKAA